MGLKRLNQKGDIGGKIKKKIAELMPPERLLAIAPISFVIYEFIIAKNWQGMKGFCEVALQTGQMIQSDLDLIKSILSDEGIEI